MHKAILLSVVGLISLHVPAQTHWGGVHGSLAIKEHRMPPGHTSTSSIARGGGVRYGFDLGHRTRFLLTFDLERQEVYQNFRSQLPPYEVTDHEFSFVNAGFGLNLLFNLGVTERREWRLLLGFNSISTTRLEIQQNEGPSEVMRQQLPMALVPRAGIRYAHKIAGRSYLFVEGWGGWSLIFGDDRISRGGMGRYLTIPTPVEVLGLSAGIELGPKVLPGVMVRGE